MKENFGLNLSFDRKSAALLVDLLSRAETQPGDEAKDALREMIKTALHTPPQPSLEVAKEEARTGLAQAIDALAQAQITFAEAIAHAGESGQHTASAMVSAEETKLQGAQAAYDIAAERALEARAETAEGNRRAAYAKSEKAHDEALAALRCYEPLALEMLKLFKILSFHSDLALADIEAADDARISPHAANAANHLRKVLQEQKLGHSEAVTKHVLAALHELELAAHVGANLSSVIACMQGVQI
jgi:hypothetical protein